MHPVDARNLTFYQTVGTRFSSTRQGPWRGWDRIPLSGEGPLRVLDVGCGNGRLYPYLSRRTPCVPLRYVGVDFSPALLSEAARIEPRPEDAVAWVRGDIHAFDDGALYDRIFVFGVLHHIAGADRRTRLLLRLKERLAPDGQLWMTVWQFGEDPRYANRGRKDPSEAGAVWMDFDGAGQRYCVAIGFDEVDGYAEALGLTEIDRFHADGKSGRLNLYLGFSSMIETMAPSGREPTS